MLCPHCKMITNPMGVNCEFCGQDVTKKPKKEEENE